VVISININDIKDFKQLSPILSKKIDTYGILYEFIYIKKNCLFFNIITDEIVQFKNTEEYKFGDSLFDYMNESPYVTSQIHSGIFQFSFNRFYNKYLRAIDNIFDINIKIISIDLEEAEKLYRLHLKDNGFVIKYNYIPLHSDLPKMGQSKYGMIELRASIFIKTMYCCLLNFLKAVSPCKYNIINEQYRDVDTNWLIYLPSTMSPGGNSEKMDYLEYPTDSFNYFKRHGVKKVICEKKHMGNRAIIIIAKNAESASNAFNASNGEIGVIYTRTAKHFFNDMEIEKKLLTHLNNRLTENNFWEEFNSTWVCFDVEIMPWSIRAYNKLKHNYFAISSTSIYHTNEICSILNSIKDIADFNDFINNLIEEYRKKLMDMYTFNEVLLQYIENVDNYFDIKIAPFHILAVDKKTFFDKTHEWHLKSIAHYCVSGSPIFMETDFFIVDLENEVSIDSAIKWWINVTHNDGEGMVVKPLNFVSYDKYGYLLQPYLKCRGKKYLMIVYGYDYLDRLSEFKSRSLEYKQKEAIREFILGRNALESFISNIHDKEKRLHYINEIFNYDPFAMDPRL